jgi:ribose/xylose/arabinose/galactoside ABC-type transport system permease subunit
MDLLWTLAAKREYGLILVLAVIIAAVSIRNPGFLSVGNLWDLLTNCTQPAIVACGVMLVIVTGEIDISVGAALGLLTACLAWMVSPTHFGWHPAVGIVAMLAIGTLIGLVNGLLVTLVRIPSIIVTLAMMTILRGITTLLMKPGDITDMPMGVRFFGIGEILTIPVSLFVTALVIAATAAMIKFTPAGRRIFAVGSNAHAAGLSGISEVKTKILVFTLTGFLVGVAVLVSRLATVTSGFGGGFELLVVTCVVVGGVAISGGKGTVLGVMLGVALLTIQKPVLIFLNLGNNAAYWEKAIQGGLILIAVLVDHLASRRVKGPGGGH